MRAYLQERKWLKESRLTKAHHSMCDGSQNWGPGVCHSLQASQQARVSPPGEKTRPSSSSWGRCRAHAQVYLPGNFQTQPLSCSPLDEVSSQLILASRGLACFHPGKQPLWSESTGQDQKCLQHIPQRDLFCSHTPRGLGDEQKAGVGEERVSC